MKPDTRIICGLDPLRQEPSGPRLAVDNTTRLSELEAQRRAALAEYHAAPDGGRLTLAALERLAQVRAEIARERARLAGGRCA